MDRPDEKRATWGSEINRSNHRAHADFPTTVSPFGRIFVDKGVRKSKCFACHESIVKGTPRFVILTLRPQTLTFRNGGRSRLAKCFAHVSCVRKILRNVPAAKDHRQCLGCEVVLNELVVQASTTRNGEWGWLCLNCSLEGRFIKCTSCKIMYPKGMCSLSTAESPILDDFEDDMDHPSGSVICDSCSLNYSIPTLRSVTRRETADKQFDGRLRAAITQVSEWIPGGRVKEHHAEGSGTTRQHRR